MAVAEVSLAVVIRITRVSAARTLAVIVGLSQIVGAQMSAPS